MSAMEVPAVAAGNRLDRFLAEANPEVSRAEVQRWIEAGRVRVNGDICTKNKFPLVAGMTVEWESPAPAAPFTLTPETFDFPILHEDDAVLIIDKPAGLVVHPAPGHSGGTLVNALLSHIPDLAIDVEETDIDQPPRPGIVHRLDKETSGCIVVAKTAAAQSKLSRAFAERLTKKTYLAITYRAPKTDEGHIENMIGRHPVSRQKMAVLERGGRLAITDYQVLGRGLLEGSAIALVRVQIHTGRTHQIRVHLASLGAPVLGDTVYGGRQPPLAERQLLHAHTLDIPHPVTRKRLKVVAPLPTDIQSVIDRTRWDGPLPDPIV